MTAVRGPPHGGECGYTVIMTYDVTIEGRPPTVAHAFADLVNGHDPDAVDGFLAVDHVNHNPFVADGREADRAFWASWFAAFPDTAVVGRW